MIGLLAVAAIGVGAAILLAGPGAGAGFWTFRDGFSAYRTLALPATVLGGLAFVGALVATFGLRAPRLAVFAVLGALVAGAGVGLTASLQNLVAANPFIHDITTDMEDPPQIVAAAGAERKNPPRYVGDDPVGDTGKTVAEAQIAAYPDVVPIILDADVETATAKARAALDAMGLDVIAEGPAGPEAADGWRIEAVATTRWFKFKDDFIVRLRPAEEPGRTRIDVRSKSRIGGSDLGTNAKRIRAFSTKLQAAA
ncbi:MAG: DUF1499 domain-containing protein [Pseudomonadota bacterium]